MASNRTEAKRLGEHIAQLTNGRIGLTTYSPGDGITRYRLGTTDAADGLHDYFGDRALCTALGAADALTMLQGFLQGWWAVPR